MGLSDEMEITYGDHPTDAEMEDEDIDLEEDKPASADLIEMLGFDPDEEPDEE